MNSGLGKFIKDVGWSFVSLGISALVHFILRIILARYFSVDELGLYSLSFTAYSFGLLIAGMGMQGALVKYTAQYKNDSSVISSLFSSSIFLSLSSGILLGIILYISAPFIASNILSMPEMKGLLRLVALAFPFIALQKNSLGVLNGFRRMWVFAAINIFQNILVLAITVLFVILEYDINGIILALVIPVVITSTISLFTVRKFISKPDIKLHGAIIKALFAFSIYAVFSRVISTTQGYIDSWMIGYYLNSVDVGIYAIALTLREGLLLPSHAIQMITAPLIASYWGKNDLASIEMMINRIMKCAAVFMLPVVFILFFFASEMISFIFGSSYVSAALPLQILIGGIFLRSIQSSIGSALASTAFVSVLFKIGIFTLVLSVILNVVLIPLFGISGAALATMTTTVISVLVSIYLMERLIKIRIQWMWFARLILFGGLLFGLTWLFSLAISKYVLIPAISAVLLMVLYKVFISAEDKVILKMLFNKMKIRG